MFRYSETTMTKTGHKRNIEHILALLCGYVCKLEPRMQ